MPSPAIPPAAPSPLLPRLPAPLLALALPAVLIGLFGIFSSVSDLTDSFADRTTSLLRTQERALRSLDAGLLQPPLSSLPREEVGRLALLLGVDRHEHRGVAIPLGLLNLLSSWLLCTGALGTLRKSRLALRVWSWAALVNLPYALLSLVVTWVRARDVMAAVGTPAATALAAVTQRPVQAELDGLWILCRGYLTLLGMWNAILVLYLLISAVYLNRLAGPEPPAEDDDSSDYSALA